MSFLKVSMPWGKIIKVFLLSLVVILFGSTLIGTYLLGFINGYGKGIFDAKETLISYSIKPPEMTKTRVSPTPTAKDTPKKVIPKTLWGGPELWDAVNQKRQEYGVNSLSQKDELCTIASIRLNELLELGKLDGHEGFSNMTERRSDLKWIFEKYSVVAEFLAMGGESPEDTVSLWENTLGHKKLLEGGEYVWGCIYAQDTFAVAITAY